MTSTNRKKTHRTKYYIPYSDEKTRFTDSLEQQRLTIIHNPAGDGNCQFSALCYHLSGIGIYRSAETLRKEIVQYLRNHPYGADGFPLELFIGQPWDQYLSTMENDGTFGDHITLQAVADIFLVQITVYSSLGPAATQVISPHNGINPIAYFSVGHFAEGMGEHYVCLNDRQEIPHQIGFHEIELHTPTCNTSNDVESEPAESAVASSENGQDLPEYPQPFLNQDVLEKIIKLTVHNFPMMRSALSRVSHFFKDVVDGTAYPKIYLPELDKIADLDHVSVRRIMHMKGRLSGVILNIKDNIIKSTNWANAWLKVRWSGKIGWYIVKSIYWKKKK